MRDHASLENNSVARIRLNVCRGWPRATRRARVPCVRTLTFLFGSALLLVAAASGCSSDSGDSGTSAGGSSASSGSNSGGSSASSAGGTGGTAAAGGSAASSSSGGVGGGGSTGVGGSGTGGAGTGGSGTGGSGTGGFGTGGSTGGGAGTGVGGCLPVDVQCGASGATCCAGSECVPATPEPLCLIPCEADGDCTSGCCMKFGNVSQKVCGTAAECASCVAVGQPCSSQNPCCSSICVAFGESKCTQECTVDADCPNNCCRPLGNVSVSVCLDPCPQ